MLCLQGLHKKLEMKRKEAFNVAGHRDVNGEHVINLTTEELRLVRACISVAKDSISEGALLASPKEGDLIENNDINEVYAKFLG